MADLPGPVWMIAGIFIGVVSLFLGFLKPIENNAFFQLMFVVGIGMVVFGFIKGKLSAKSPQEMMEERRQQRMQRGETEVEIDIDNYRNNPRLRQDTLQRRNSPYSSSTQPAHYGTPRTHPMQQQQYPQRPQQPAAYHPSPQQHPASNQRQSFCSQCGTPLLKSHKFCPICGARV